MDVEGFEGILDGGRVGCRKRYEGGRWKGKERQAYEGIKICQDFEEDRWKLEQRQEWG